MFWFLHWRFSLIAFANTGLLTFRDGRVMAPLHKYPKDYLHQEQSLANQRSKRVSYLFSLPLQHIQTKATIINPTKIPPNVTKNIPKEVSCGAVGGSRRGGVVKVILVGLTDDAAIVIDAEDIYLVAEILVRFGEITVLVLSVSVAEVEFIHHEGLEGRLVILEEVVEELDWLSWPVIRVIISQKRSIEALIEGIKEWNLNSNYTSSIVCKANIYISWVPVTTTPSKWYKLTYNDCRWYRKIESSFLWSYENETWY